MENTNEKIEYLNSFWFQRFPANVLYEDFESKIEYYLKQIRWFNRVEKNINVYIFKDQTKSEKFRLKGNDFYGKGLFYKAVEFYNRSICFAPSCSLSLVKGYLNRSQVMLKLKYYKECLKNIEMVKNTKIELPNDLLKKIQYREKICHENFRKDDDQFRNDLKLSYASNPDIPYLIDGIEIQNNLYKGRGIFTKKPLKPGDVVLIENTIFTVKQSGVYLCCRNCRSNELSCFIPCPNCTQSMYCNEECLKEDKKIHKIECPIIGVLTKFSQVGLSFRIIMKIIGEYDNDLMKCYKSIKTLFNTPDAFNNFSLKELFVEKCGSLGIGNLKIDGEEQTDLDYFYNDVFCAFIVLIDHFVSKRTSFTSDYIYNQKAFLSLMFNFYKILRWNSAGDEITLYFNIFGSLINHSCIPNCSLGGPGDKTCVYVIKNVAENEELCINYCFKAFSMPANKRKEMLKSKFEFDCKCYACLHNIDTDLENIFYNLPYLELLADIEDYDIDESTRESVKNMYNRCCSFLQKHSKKNDVTTLIQIFLIQHFQKLCKDENKIPQTSDQN